MSILFNDSVDVNVRRVKTDSGGNLVVLDLKIYEYEITLASLYAPNTDSPDFFSNLESIILEFENPHVIICGDWNLVQDKDLDMYNYLHVHHPRAIGKRLINLKKI